MSGGHFDYAQYHISDIWAEIEDYVEGHELDDEDLQDYIKYHCLGDEEKAYVEKHKHTIPNSYGLSEETLREFRKAVKLLKQAEVYAERIDWLLSGDDGEETFHKRLKEDLEALETKSN